MRSCSLLNTLGIMMRHACNLLLLIMPAMAVVTNYSQLNNSYIAYIFGDSLVDAGNNDYIFTLSKADSPPYGIDFSPSGGRPTGRFTNGKTISDIIGQLLGAKSFSPPYLAPSSHGPTILGGVNYASGAAGILNDTGSLFIGRISLDTQINNFENTRGELVRMLGEKNAEDFLRKVIFSVTIGANDFLNNYLEPIVSIPERARISPDKFERMMIVQFRRQLLKLYSLGARKFIISAVGPIGCIPYDRIINLVPPGRCAESSNEMARAYNALLRDLIVGLNTKLAGAFFVYANAYDSVLEILQNFGNYGFENAADPCCGDVIPPVPCSLRSNMCQDRSKYVFWDAYHPTEAANMIIAKQFLDGDQRFVYPINVRQLFLL